MQYPDEKVLVVNCKLFYCWSSFALDKYKWWKINPMEKFING